MWHPQLQLCVLAGIPVLCPNFVLLPARDNLSRAGLLERMMWGKPGSNPWEEGGKLCGMQWCCPRGTHGSVLAGGRTSCGSRTAGCATWLLRSSGSCPRTPRRTSCPSPSTRMSLHWGESRGTGRCGWVRWELLWAQDEGEDAFGSPQIQGDAAGWNSHCCFGRTFLLREILSETIPK